MTGGGESSITQKNGSNSNSTTKGGASSLSSSSSPKEKPRYGQHAAPPKRQSSDRTSQRLYKLLILVTVLSMTFMVFLNSNEIYQDVVYLQQHQQQQQHHHVSLHHGQDALRKAFVVEDSPLSRETKAQQAPSLEEEKKDKKKTLEEDQNKKTLEDKKKDYSKTTSHSNSASNNNNNKEDDDSNLRLVEIVERATGTLLDASLKAQLPPWSRVVELYGPEPVIFGLDSCRTFQESIPAADAYIGPAGMFNTGTNLLAQLLAANCQLPQRRRTNPTGMRWQVPWGKHSPVALRLVNVAQAGGYGIVQKHVLAVVTTKDPYAWMGSMCRHSYAANWPHFKEHCPNLVPNEVDVSHKVQSHVLEGPHNPHQLATIPVNVRFNPHNITHHASLADLWNDWYGAYFDETPHSNFPRLIVRFEDLLLHTESVVQQVCKCGGGVAKTAPHFRYVTESAKGSGGPHSGSSGLISALLRYTNTTLRQAGFQEADLQYAATALRSDLMDYFHYPIVVPASEAAEASRGRE